MIKLDEFDVSDGLDEYQGKKKCLRAENTGTYDFELQEGTLDVYYEVV